MNIREITLGKIAVSSLLFRSLTSYNDSLERLNESTQGSIEITNPEHRLFFLEWLNDWGCRSLSKDHHKVASASILEWYLQVGTRLFSSEKPLWNLDDNDLEIATEAYDCLKNKTGAWRIQNQSEQEVHIGATAASKVLFAIRPQALAPWDKDIRFSFKCDGSAKSYLKYLKAIRDITYHIRDMCRQKGFKIEEFLLKTGRPNSTPITLINEYLDQQDRENCAPVASDSG